MSYSFNAVRDALLRGIWENPGDEGRIAVFADWLEEHDRPRPVALGRCPNWLRLAWLRIRRAARRGGTGQVAGLGFRPQTVVTGWQVMLDIQRNGEGLGFRPSLFDHHGTATVAGIPNCLVLEPYVPFAEAARAFLRLGPIVGGIPAASRKGSWNESVARIILFPPLLTE